MRKKIALVNQRYGLEVNGGSEALCRQMAEKLKDDFEVEVITTCALDYLTWANHYPSGESEINGVKVRRFPVERPRNLKKFGELSGAVLEHRDYTFENAWVEEQGPYSVECTEWLKEHHSEYDAVIYMTYLYYLTVKMLSENDMKNAVLLPTAHDEAPFHLPIYNKVFQNAKAFIYLTDEEKELVENKYGVAMRPNVITGAGVDVPPVSELFDVKERYGFENYMLYVGRIDENKGCDMLFKYFSEFKKRNGYEDLKLVLCGKSVIEIPKRDDIVSLGFVTDEEKFSLIKDCKLLVLASEFESLSMVVLEAMTYNRPVLVNGKCKVLKGHCVKSNAGLYFCDYFEFEGALKYMLENGYGYETMCKNGSKYIENNYRWDVILKKIAWIVDSI